MNEGYKGKGDVMGFANIKTISLWAIFFTFIYSLPALFWAYHMFFSMELQLSANSADWGGFGSYVGGVLTPVFTVFGYYFIYSSIVHSDDNHKKQMDELKRQNRLSHLTKLLDAFDKWLEDGFEERLSGSNRLVITDEKTGERFFPTPIYQKDRKPRNVPTKSNRALLSHFHMSKNSKDAFTKHYIDLVETSTGNAEICLRHVFAQVLKLEDKDEFDMSLDVVESIADYHCMISIFERNLHSLKHYDQSPTLDLLLKINERSNFFREYSEEYKNILSNKLKSPKRKSRSK